MSTQCVGDELVYRLAAGDRQSTEENVHTIECRLVRKGGGGGANGGDVGAILLGKVLSIS